MGTGLALAPGGAGRSGSVPSQVQLTEVPGSRGMRGLGTFALPVRPSSCGGLGLAGWDECTTSDLWGLGSCCASLDGPCGALSVPGSDQAREGRLVDALAARGEEGRDTLR